MRISNDLRELSDKKIWQVLFSDQSLHFPSPYLTLSGLKRLSVQTLHTISVFSGSAKKDGLIT